MLSEIAPALREYLGGITPILPRAIDCGFMVCGGRAVTTFGREYFQRYRSELSGLSARATGSERIAGFQSFGTYDWLKALYAQRYALRRKLSQSLDPSKSDL
jgi:hypothetical protein